jgi:hypothetical protein
VEVALDRRRQRGERLAVDVVQHRREKHEDDDPPAEMRDAGHENSGWAENEMSAVLPIFTGGGGRDDARFGEAVH